MIRAGLLENIGEGAIPPVPDSQTLVISRVMDFPREEIFQAWTDASILAEWWGPHAFTNPVCEMEATLGGHYRLVMRSPEGTDYPITGMLVELTFPERLVMTMDCSEHPQAWHDQVKPDRAADEQNPVGQMLQTLTLTERDGQVFLDLSLRFESPEILNAMVAQGILAGWNEGLDSLVALLAHRGRSALFIGP